MPLCAHPGRLLKRELADRKLSVYRPSLDIGVLSGRVTDILHARRSIPADTAVRLGAISASARSSGSIYRANSISPLSSATAAASLLSACGRPTRRDVAHMSEAIGAAGRDRPSDFASLHPGYEANLTSAPENPAC